MGDLEQHLHRNSTEECRQLPPTLECCCGYSVQTGIKIIAIVSLLMDVLGVAVFITIMIPMLITIGRGDVESTVGWIITGVVTTIVLLTLVNVAFNVFLLKGAHQANLKYCRNWITCTEVMIGLSVSLIVISLLILYIPGVAGQTLVLLKYLYCLSEVKTFVCDLEANPVRYFKNGQVLS